MNQVDDFSACVAECEAKQELGEEISDGCARTIGALYAEGMGSGQAFSTTGTITDNTWWDLFGAIYADIPPNEQLLADMLGTYLDSVGGEDGRGPVPDWSSVWVR